MHPYLNLFGFELPAFGLMTIAGLAVATGIIALRAKRYGFELYDPMLVVCIATVGGIAGAFIIKPIIRLPGLIINWDVYLQIPLRDFIAWYFGGLVFYGGLIGGMAAAMLYCRYFKLPALKIADLAAPAIPIGHALGRIGCFLGGCCYGVQVSVSHPFAVIYPERTDRFDMMVAPAGLPLLAIPIIEAAINLLIACLLLLIERKNKRQGQCLAIYGLLYSIQRFTLEFFRGDIDRGFALGMSTSQWISIFIFGGSILFFILIKTSIGTRLQQF